MIKSCLVLCLMMAFMLLFVSCGCISKTSEGVYFRGKIVTGSRIDTTINVYALGNSYPIFDTQGAIRVGVVYAVHPDTSGLFVFVGGATNSHCSDNPGDQTQVALLRIYIESSNFKPYYDSLTSDQLAKLTRISSEEAGITYSDPKYSIGVWVLPDIVLQPK